MQETTHTPSAGRAPIERGDRNGVQWAWARFRSLLEPPRRLEMLKPGIILIIGIFGLGFATLNTGNNVLYLLLGALLGLIALSGWLSERSLQRNRITRILPSSVTAGHSARIEYRVVNLKRHLPTVALELRDTFVPHAQFTAAFVPVVEPGEEGAGIAQVQFERRGVYSLHRLAAGTAYPFGLFRKERDLALDGYVTVWPRTDRVVRAPVPAGKRGLRKAAGAGAALGAERGEFRALRPYRTGDDPRDVHWRSTARRGEPIMREYDRDAAESYWIVLDTVASNDLLFEVAVEIAASLIARAADSGERVGCAIGSVRVPAGPDATPVHAVLDELARAQRMDESAGTGLQLPATPAECVIVTARGIDASGYADVFNAGDQSAGL